jgi:protein-S-isoprenylcysteine O-methyltransferase Ste14
MAQSSTLISPPRLNRYGANGFARQLSIPIFNAIMLFIGAGALDWMWGWVFTVVYFLGWLGLDLVLVRANPELLNERGKRARQLTGTKRWDWVVMSLYAVLLLAQPFLAGLDWRNGWSPAPSPLVCLAGNALTILALAILAWTMAYNRFFEATVRIQEQRGHQVVSSGPYRYVRHPGYVGVILTLLAQPIALGTWTALTLGVIGGVLFVARTALEDRTLQRELPGYAEYARQTRYRLIPGVW